MLSLVIWMRPVLSKNLVRYARSLLLIIRTYSLTKNAKYGYWFYSLKILIGALGNAPYR
ncbi:hypothetical protein Cylst_0500 [Cylindrospermum stagnale PCC 7417]|uniref:Uncharacterized protein n=1 Tax=Cylindrospermum stagnale PCC 7417 TaxID=56107 RepID=K9WSR0_9NOST|nr:hypothetical protein Cylst_0500 [Cylindrospermum stagnale PCC 7417]